MTISRYLFIVSMLFYSGQLSAQKNDQTEKYVSFTFSVGINRNWILNDVNFYTGVRQVCGHRNITVPFTTPFDYSELPLSRGVSDKAVLWLRADDQKKKITVCYVQAKTDTRSMDLKQKSVLPQTAPYTSSFLMYFLKTQVSVLPDMTR